MEDLLAAIRSHFRELSSAEGQEKAQHFFKESLKSYGIKNPIVHGISKQYLPVIRPEPKAFILKICEALWASGYIEEALVACDWLQASRKKLEQKDFYTFSKWIDRYVNNWASCDTFCNHTMGYLTEQYPVLVRELLPFTSSGNRWMRRAAAVSLIVPAKKGLFWAEIQAICSALLTDKDDMVQKGYGWLLKEASKAHEEEVFGFVVRHKAVMPRTALRYAIEKMPSDKKAAAMAK